jgi:putative oxidoreductase
MSKRLYSFSILLHKLAPALLVLLYTYAAASKLVDLDAFGKQLARQPIPEAAANLLKYALPTAELLLAGMLLLPRSLRTGLQVSLALLFLFSGYVSLALLHWWSRYPCSCGGILGHLPWGWHLLFNLFFLALNLAALWQPPRRPQAGPG